MLDKQRKGFAVISPERRREIAAMGGKATQASGKGHRFTTEEVRLAGQKGGRVRQQKRNPTA